MTKNSQCCKNEMVEDLYTIGSTVLDSLVDVSIVHGRESACDSDSKCLQTSEPGSELVAFDSRK